MELVHFSQSDTLLSTAYPSGYSSTSRTMDAPATPKHRKQLNRDQRLQVRTLKDAKFTHQIIATQLSITLRQVEYALHQPLSPGKKTGRPPSLSPQQTQELIQFITSSREARQISYLSLAQHFQHWGIREHAIRSVLKNAGFSRRIALSKPPLTEVNKAKRLAWAEAHINWTRAQWNTILWSDET